MADPLAYWRQSFDPRQNAKIVFNIVDPTPYDNSYDLGQYWLNKTSKTMFTLTGRANGLAVWEQVDNLTDELTDGEIQIGSTGSPPIASCITAGNNVTVTNGPGSITISSADPLAPQQFEVVTGSQAIVPNTTYYIAALSHVNLTLPVLFPAGYVVVILGLGATFTIKQQASQMIRFHSQNTTLGTSGELQSTSAYECITLTCVVENDLFIVHPSTGNFNLV